MEGKTCYKRKSFLKKDVEIEELENSVGEELGIQDHTTEQPELKCNCFVNISNLQSESTSLSYERDNCLKYRNTSDNKNFAEKYYFQIEYGKGRCLRCRKCGLMKTRSLHSASEETISTDHRGVTSKRPKKSFGIASLSFFLFITLQLCQNILCLDSNDILQLNIPTEEPVIDPNTICKTFPELSTRQYRLCSKYPDVTASAIQGIQIAVHECQYQMKEHRWNCSSLEKKNKNPHSSPLLKKGYKESAFAYALASAGVTHQVSKACSMGKLKSCGCDMSMQGEVRDKFEWGGCSHNVEFGDNFARKFTRARETARDIHARINLHNNRAGRLVILKNVKKQCKCHGMSGSCEIKTCWKVSPEFRIVGEILKKKYEKASRVNISNKTSKKTKRRLVKKQKNSELVYYEKSPNYCDPNPEVDSPGTTGRFCNKSSTGLDNCDTLCCGRGHNTLRVRRAERCNCKFHWCCYVVCQTCVSNEWVTVCK
ncbi:protein Wnt-10b-like [Mercenaria mercenaria]|uniref:protein Wnt-10b-like n=1 Tax=Mercenaria mercenaria TaxID=6596 RepID=UPI00234EFD7D|nr:protein Wnt-10b-like [Mercenaria mercenaria]